MLISRQSAFQVLWTCIILLFLAPANGYDIVRDYSGQAFFEGWDFFGGWDNLTLGVCSSHPLHALVRHK